MAPDDLLVFQGYDFTAPDALKVLHTAFSDQTCPLGARPRRSIELRPDLFTVKDKRAYLVSSALAKMQWRRSGGYGESAVFDDREDALAWLQE